MASRNLPTLRSHILTLLSFDKLLSSTNANLLVQKCWVELIIMTKDVWTAWKKYHSHWGSFFWVWR